MQEIVVSTFPHCHLLFLFYVAIPSFLKALLYPIAIQWPASGSESIHEIVNIKRTLFTIMMCSPLGDQLCLINGMYTIVNKHCFTVIGN